MPLGEVGNRALRVEGRAPGGQAGLVSEDGNRAKHTHGGAGSWPLTPQGRAPKVGTTAPAPAPAPGGPHTPTLRPGRMDSWAWKGPTRLPRTPRSVPELCALRCSPLSLENDLIFMTLLQVVLFYLFVNYFLGCAACGILVS